MTDEPQPDDELDAREAARVRRRDHDAEAARRDLMRSGMGKVFKQILTAGSRRRRPRPAANPSPAGLTAPAVGPGVRETRGPVVKVSRQAAAPGRADHSSPVIDASSSWRPGTTDPPAGPRNP